MENETNLPFKVGDLAEVKTFEEGFRGAWFRCKIRDITKKEGRLVYLLEYYDFTEEELDWVRVYQVPPYPMGDAKEEHEELMLRPCYPPICNKKQIRHVIGVSEVTAVINNSWKLGDLVEWCSNDCYWTGRIIQLFGNGTAKIELNPPPLGEGSDYDAFLKDVRPSLDWSIENGWIIPTQEGSHRCARLMKPVNQVGRIQKKSNAVMGSTGSSARLSHCPASSNSAVSVSTRTETLKQSLIPGQEEKCTSRGRECSSKSRTDQDVESGRSHEYRAGDGFPLELDTVDAAVIKLEEYVNKVKWLRRILDCGISSDAERPPWEVEVQK